MYLIVFFFKQKSAYEMRISDWSSDVCSSDLRYRSNMHRVLNRGAGSGRDRYSVPFFYTPDHHARIECLPGCSDVENPPRYRPCTAGEHMMEMFNRSYGRKAEIGRAHV